jgi:hypothetical protein
MSREQREFFFGDGIGDATIDAALGAPSPSGGDTMDVDGGADDTGDYGNELKSAIQDDEPISRKAFQRLVKPT